MIKSVTTQLPDQKLHYVACLNLTTINYDEIVYTKCMRAKKKTTIHSAR